MTSIDHARTRRRNGAGWMIAVAAAAAFLATFNETFLNVAFTPIMQDLGVDVGTVQWLATGYLLVAAIFVPVANVLYQRFPTRPLFVSVVAIMVAGSIIGALAPSFGVLLGGRLLQAIGTGLLTPIGMNITLAVSPREKLGMNMGIMAAMTTLGPSLAIVLSGALLSVAPWNVLMWVFGGLALVVLLAGAAFLTTVTDLGRPTFDVLSFVLIAVALAGILYGVTAAFGGSAVESGGSGLIGVLALWLFVRRQKRIANPLIDLRPFASRAFVLGVSMTILGLLFVFAMNVVIPLFLQGAWGVSPLGASLTLAPGILLTVVLGPVAGRLFDKHGGRWSIPAGFLVMAVFVSLVGMAAGMDSILLFGLLYVPAVLATAFVIGPAQTFALASLDRESSPHGVTVVSTSFQIAGCVGTSLAAGVYGALSARGDLMLGFRGAVLLVVVTSVVGIVLAWLSQRSRAQAPVGSEGTVAELMKRDVYTLQDSMTVAEALKMFRARGISGAPIVSGGKLVGFLSDGDVMRYLASSSTPYSLAAGDDLTQAMRDLGQLNVMRLAAHPVIFLDANSSIPAAVAALSDMRLKKAPVVSDGKLVGIVSRSAINLLVTMGE